MKDKPEARPNQPGGWVLVGSASTVTAWQHGTDAHSVSSPSATPTRPSVPWHMPAPCHHLDALRTAWRELVASVPMIRPACWRAGGGKKSGRCNP
ncbi:MAG: hypothetical protein BWK72_14890 [Rhodoferax ferrireducens]|uniref:Uncharacterized protein n=1 Tax=Rhodoferax ferrireducens TaxID=192843 RepID=A0A1W9KSP9_9BURK|nr:MAG: hypothetical protein BWK72_14890 [Rhodoferax ferrireducens]